MVKQGVGERLLSPECPALTVASAASSRAGAPGDRYVCAALARAGASPPPPGPGGAGRGLLRTKVTPATSWCALRSHHVPARSSPPLNFFPTRRRGGMGSVPALPRGLWAADPGSGLTRMATDASHRTHRQVCDPRSRAAPRGC